MLYTTAMKIAKFLQILRKHYSEPMVKAIRNNVCRPSYEKMCQMQEEDGIELELWKDVRGWFNRQKEKEKLAKEMAKERKAKTRK